MVAHSKLQRRHQRQRKANAASRTLHTYILLTPERASSSQAFGPLTGTTSWNDLRGALATLCRTPFSAVQQLESVGKSAIALATTAVTKMKANCTDAPYISEKGSGAAAESSCSVCCGVRANLCARA